MTAALAPTRADAATRVADRAIVCLRSGAPFSLVRLGDGEGRLLAYPDGISRKMLYRHLYFWFGRVDFTEMDVMAMQAILQTAIDQSDAIGCNPNGANGPWWDVPWRYVQAAHLAHRVCGINDLHRELWHAGELDRIAQNAERIVVVTCRDVTSDLIVRWRKPVSRVKVPGEGMEHGIPTPHWDWFSGLENVVAEMCAPGVLCLVGAGVLGKAYTVRAARAGAVALDVGSVFDGWGRIESRSYLAGKLGEYRL